MPVAKQGLNKKMFTKGLHKEKMERRSFGGNRLIVKAGETKIVQFATSPNDFVEYEIHNFNDGSWQFVPCLGENCPLCEDDNSEISKTRYRFASCVWSHQDKKILILEGPKDLAMRIWTKYERKPGTFLKKVFEITKFPGTPVSWQVEVADDDAPVQLQGKKLLDLEEFVMEEVKRFHGDDVLQAAGGSTKTALDDDEEEEPAPKAAAGKKAKQPKVPTCDECGQPLDSDLDCENEECPKYYGNEPEEETPAAAAEGVCPECGTELDAEGDCENLECEWTNPANTSEEDDTTDFDLEIEEEEPAPKPKVKPKLAAVGGKKTGKK